MLRVVPDKSDGEWLKNPEQQEEAHLVGGAIAVLDAAQQAVGLLALPLHVQHHIHHVLEDPWTCYFSRLQGPHGGWS